MVEYLVLTRGGTLPPWTKALLVLLPCKGSWILPRVPHNLSLLMPHVQRTYLTVPTIVNIVLVLAMVFWPGDQVPTLVPQLPAVHVSLLNQEFHLKFELSPPKLTSPHTRLQLKAS